jgi:hypothetical protein
VIGGVLLLLHAALALGYLARRRPLDPLRGVIVTVLAVIFAGHLALSLRWGEAEGRFLLPALAPIVYLIVAPVHAIAERIRWGERAAWIYLIALAAHPYLFLALG